MGFHIIEDQKNKTGIDPLYTALKDENGNYIINWIKVKDISDVREYSGIYELTFDTNKKYLGQSRNLYQRIGEHDYYIKHSNLISIQWYSEPNIITDICVCYSGTKDDAIVMEHQELFRINKEGLRSLYYNSDYPFENYRETDEAARQERENFRIQGKINTERLKALGII